MYKIREIQDYKNFSPSNGGDRVTISEASGIVKIERSSDLRFFKLTATDVYIKAKVTPGKETPLEKEVEGTLLLDGTISGKLPNPSNESDIWEFYTEDLIQNYVVYGDIEANMDFLKKKFIKAVCNGTQADCDTLTKELL